VKTLARLFLHAHRIAREAAPERRGAASRDAAGAFEELLQAHGDATATAAEGAQPAAEDAQPAARGVQPPSTSTGLDAAPGDGEAAKSAPESTGEAALADVWSAQPPALDGPGPAVRRPAEEDTAAPHGRSARNASHPQAGPVHAGGSPSSSPAPEQLAAPTALAGSMAALAVQVVCGDAAASTGARAAAESDPRSGARSHPHPGAVRAATTAAPPGAAPRAHAVAPRRADGRQPDDRPGPAATSAEGDANAATTAERGAVAATIAEGGATATTTAAATVALVQTTGREVPPDTTRRVPEPTIAATVSAPAAPPAATAPPLAAAPPSPRTSARGEPTGEDADRAGDRARQRTDRRERATDTQHAPRGEAPQVSTVSSDPAPLPRPPAEQVAGARGAAEHAPTPASTSASAIATAPGADRKSAEQGKAAESARRGAGGAAEPESPRGPALLPTPVLGAPITAELHAEASRARAPVPSPLPALPIEPGEAVVSGAVMPSVAHLHVSSDTLGDVALHLRIQDGAAHVRVEGGSRAALEARAPELARALAAEGLGLARLEHEPRGSNHPQQGGQGAAQGDPGGDRRGSAEGHSSSDGRERGEPPPPPRAPARPTTTRTPRAHGGAHDVTA
jgi:flagellar hook-length control protein FliK